MRIQAWKIRLRGIVIDCNALTIVGKAIITISGNGNYTGSVSLDYSIVPVASEISNIEIGSSKVMVEWNKSNAIGYEIYYSTDKTSDYKMLISSTKTSVSSDS